MNRLFLFIVTLFICLQTLSYFFFQKIYLTTNSNSGGLTPMSNGGLESISLFVCFYLINLALCITILKWKKSGLIFHFIALSWALLLLQGLFATLNS